MNIFATHNNPRIAAYALDDLRTNKMIVESAQMLSTALVLHGGPVYYKPCYHHHPCTVWTGTSRANWKWLHAHAMFMCKRFLAKTGRNHMTHEILVDMKDEVNFLPVNRLTPFANCSLFKDVSVIAGYRQTMLQKWETDYKQPTWFDWDKTSKWPELSWRPEV